MNVLILIDRLKGGGAEAVTVRLANAMADLGVQVTLVTFEQESASPNLSQKVVHHLIDPGQGKSWGKPVFYWQTARKLKSLLGSLAPHDMALVNLPMTHRIAMKAGLGRAVYCMHTSYNTVYLKPRKGIDRWLRRRKLVKRYTGKNLVFVSQGAKDEMLRDVGARPKACEVIFNPFPIQEIRDRASSPVDIEGPFFVHLGRLHPVKRHDRLLELYAQSGITDKLLIIGTGDEGIRKRILEDAVRLGIEDGVKLLGFIENPLPYVANARGLLLCSDNEGLPTVIIESLICGTPVISLDSPSGPREILTGDLSQYLFSMVDYDGFAQKLRELSEVPTRVGEKEADLERFDHLAIAKKYLALTDKFALNKDAF